jgi:16S rRNA (cytidine1402-2'-O)-methyltransferase
MLHIVATPIGENSEITLRALEVLRAADIILCESTKETSRLLKALDIKAQRYETLNEHSTPADIADLVPLCREHNVALVSDCGTPAFCDPGSDLIRLCRKEGIAIKSVLGASSLMGLLSLSSVPLREFLFRGFLSAENEERRRQWQVLKKESRAIVLMDTPYRLKKIVDECVQNCPSRNILLAMNLSQAEECILEGRPAHVLQNLPFEKAEFMLLLYPQTVSSILTYLVSSRRFAVETLLF